ALAISAHPAKRVLPDLLCPAFDGVVRRRHRRPERGGSAHVRKIAMERAHLGGHRLRDLEALRGHPEAVSHRSPHRGMASLDSNVVFEKLAADPGAAVEQAL